ADEALSGFQLYRALHQGDFTCITDSPLSTYTRTYEDRTIEPGKEYRYIIAALTLDGREIRSTEVIACSKVPPLALNQNVPNPFNPRTTIGFFMPGTEHVQLDIYDLEGRLVQRLIDKPMHSGRHQIEWNGRDNRGRTVASGVYFYRLTAGKQTSAKKMILLR
ncbi:MAG: T9SS type A sorting domain-containing protein, partial [Candidatus Krumholzibacteria bacterium]|nr:T9SS type A sorting domain-containing protein [Candidatus Krumholzibacteria bacterium]